jgi:hypothetical protein
MGLISFANVYVRLRELYKRFFKPYSVQKIHFMDLFHPTVLKRFVSSYRVQKICFVDAICKKKSKTYLICFVLEGSKWQVYAYGIWTKIS